MQESEARGRQDAICGHESAAEKDGTRRKIREERPERHERRGARGMTHRDETYQGSPTRLSPSELPAVLGSIHRIRGHGLGATPGVANGCRHRTGTLQWYTALVHRNGTPQWYTAVHRIGTPQWHTTLAHCNGTPQWYTAMVHRNNFGCRHRHVLLPPSPTSPL